MRKSLLVAVTSSLVLLFTMGLALRTGAQTATEGGAQELAESIVVRIDVGASGEALTLPIALDLGLGFPFWLSQSGGESAAPLPFGAVPLQGPASDTVLPGASAEFRFEMGEASDSDPLQFTQQLLNGVRISDMSRVGFSGFGGGKWQLKGYEVKVNGQVLVANDSVGLLVNDVKADLETELTDVNVKIGPQQDQMADLQVFVDAELGSEEDVQLLADLKFQHAELASLRDSIEGQLNGAYPWFEESAFEPHERSDSQISGARVTLITETHPGADTRNFVYFRTGGHKYVLNPAGEPLWHQTGSQTFELDLRAGPLTAADLRGFSLGMLGTSDGYGEAPDRWHPQRMLMEIDGQYVYDSDESPIDRESLKAIRIIPPAHRNAEQALVLNKPTDRECFLWEAGKGAGLDLFAGGSLPLPPPDAEDYPKPEPDPGFSNPLLPIPDPGPFADAGGGDSSGLFPGECCGGVDNFPGPGGNWPGPGNGGGNDPGGNWPGQGGSGWNGPGGGWGSAGGPPPWVGWLIGWLLNELGHLPPGTNPPPFGTPIQVKDVVTSNGWHVVGEECAVAWSVTGDESTVDHYEVQMVRVRPDQVDPFPAAEVVTLGTAPPGSRELKANVAPAGVVPGELLFFAPRVVAVSVNPAVSPNQHTGPTRSVFPNAVAASDAMLLLDPGFGAIDGNGVVHMEQVTTGPPQNNVSRAVWVAGEVDSHNGILFEFDNVTPAFAIAARPEPSDTEMQFVFGSHGYSGRYRISSRVGFVGIAAAGNKVDVEMHCVLLSPNPADPPHFFTPVNVTVTDPAGGPPEPMQVIQQVVDSNDANFVGGLLVVLYKLRTDAVDPQHPPVLLGVSAVKTP